MCSHVAPHQCINIPHYIEYLLSREQNIILSLCVVEWMNEESYKLLQYIYIYIFDPLQLS